MIKATIFDNKQLVITKNGRKTPHWSKTEVNAYNVYIAQLKGLETVSFTFYDSIHNTYSKEQQTDQDLLYDVLCCIASDWNMDLDTSIEELGLCHTLTLRQAHKQLGEITEQVSKLQQLFTEKEIEQLSENNDNLTQFVKNLAIRRR